MFKKKRTARTRAGERARAKRWRQRQQAAARLTGWLISELGGLARLTPRTIRYYLQQGLLPPPVFRGTATRYGKVHLLRLLGIQLLKQEGVRRLSELERRLDAAGEAQLLAAVAARPHSAAVAAALGLPELPGTVASHTGAAQAAAAKQEVAPGKSTTALGESWLRLQLLPGLELSLAESASPAARQLALRLQAEWAAPR
jgi:DNA-binding transcriptional MerR regulator